MKKTGFSLVELSIVLTVIGLLAGGIVTGKKMLENARLQNLASQLLQRHKAISEFKLFYHALPGDFDNAKSFWSGCSDETGNDCNGDGDGRIERDYENIRVFQHMDFAGITNTGMTGLKGASTDYEAGVNLPNSGWGSSVIAINYNVNSQYGTYQNAIRISSIPGCDDTENRGALSSLQSRKIDKKLDDGIAHSGVVMSYKGRSTYGDCNIYHTGCVNNDPTNATSGGYKLDDPEAACVISYGFEHQDG